jgi:hypothetical protein
MSDEFEPDWARKVTLSLIPRKGRAIIPTRQRESDLVHHRQTDLDEALP